MRLVKIICVALGLAGVIVGARVLCERRKCKWV